MVREIVTSDPRRGVKLQGSDVTVEEEIPKILLSGNTLRIDQFEYESAYIKMYDISGIIIRDECVVSENALSLLGYQPRVYASTINNMNCNFIHADFSILSQKRNQIFTIYPLRNS